MAKKGKIILFLVFFLIPSTCFAWTTTNTILEGSWLVLHTIDWGQTLDISERHGKEMNPILGHHPDRARVNAYFAVTAIGHVAISYILPDKYRRYWQVITIIGTGACVTNNFIVGWRINF